MGNSHSCCTHSTPPATRKPRPLVVGGPADRLDGEREASAPNLQHISEREPGSGEPDPSAHPSAQTLFMERAGNGLGRKRSQHQIAELRKSASDLRGLKKSSSCSTIYLDDSTVSQPNLKNTVKCVALAIYYHIKNRTSERSLDIFDEKLHPLSKEPVSDEYSKHNPEHRQIYKFVRTMFNAAQLTAECAIITLIYLERLLTYVEIDISASNWKRIVLGAVLLASKVMDDQAIWNIDYCQILKDLSIEDMNELERQFLELLQFNINVPSSVYAKYYFDLRTLAEANDLSFPGEPLSKERAQKLEATSLAVQDRITQEMLRNGIKKWSSLDNVNNPGGHRKSVAILS